MTALGLQLQQQPNQPHYWEISHTRTDGNTRPISITTFRAPVPRLSDVAKVTLGAVAGGALIYMCVRHPASPKRRKLRARRR